jgi:hypothetical protein
MDTLGIRRGHTEWLGTRHELDTPWIHTGYKLDTHSIRHCVRNIMDYILDTQRIQTGYKNSTSLHTTHSGHTLDTLHAQERAGCVLYTHCIHPGCPVDPRKHSLRYRGYIMGAHWIHPGYTMDTPWIHSGYAVATRTGWARAGDTLDTPWIQSGYTFDTSLRPKHHGLHPGYALDTHWIQK